MKSTLNLVAVAALTIAVLASTANAGNLIDKGALGQYERNGRFVKPILSPSPRSDAADESVAPRPEGQVMVDKGDLGTYVRHGRFLRPTVKVGLQGWSTGAAVSPAGGVMHEHGLDGKAHRNIGRKRAS